MLFCYGTSRDPHLIRMDALPRTVFLLRETLGVDLLEVLDE
jgi:hypothetical protein